MTRTRNIHPSGTFDSVALAEIQSTGGSVISVPTTTHRLIAIVLTLAFVLVSFSPLTQTQAEGPESNSVNLPLAARASGVSASATRISDLPAIGMTIIPFDQTRLTQAKAAGAQSVLIAIHWNDVEPIRTNPPTYTWTVPDNYIGPAINSGLQPIILVDDNPTWAYSGSMKILTASGRTGLAEFVGQAVARYKSLYPGKIRIWSFYNEPDCNGPTVIPDTNIPSSCYGDFGTEYTAMLREVYPAVKAADSNALVAIGGLAYDNWGGPGTFTERFLDDVLQSGGFNYLDLMNFHYYTEFADKWNQFGSDVVGKTNYIRAVMARYNVSKPIIMTEISRRTDGVPNGEAIQADYVIQGIARAYGSGSDLAIWYELIDHQADSYNFGIIGSTGANKPAYAAYGLVSQKLAGIATTGTANTNFPGVEAYTFGSAECFRQTSVAWSADGGTKFIKLSADQVLKTERTGQTSFIRDADDGTTDGQVTVTLGSSPVFLEITPKTGTDNPGGTFRVYLPNVSRARCLQGTGA